MDTQLPLVVTLVTDYVVALISVTVVTGGRYVYWLVTLLRWCTERWLRLGCDLLTPIYSYTFPFDSRLRYIYTRLRCQPVLVTFTLLTFPVVVVVDLFPLRLLVVTALLIYPDLR